MSDSGPRIVFAEWLPTGVIVHFEEGTSVFFGAKFLFDQRDIQPNQMFRTEYAPPRKPPSSDTPNNVPVKRNGT